LGRGRVNLGKNLVRDIIPAEHGQSKNRKDHPQPVADNLKVFVEMKDLIAIFGHRKK
jgi:hypothetical protein